MPVLLSCSCGKQLRAPDDYAGRRVKCPGCGAALTVPDGDAPAPRATRPKASTPPPPSTAGMIRFTCACGKQMQAKSEYAGRMTRCPGCGEEVKIPGSEGRAAERIRADRPAKGRRAALEEDEDFRDEEEFEDRKGRGKKKKKRGVLPWVLAGVLGLVVLGGAGFGAWWFFFRSSASDMAFVPADAQGFMTIRVADVWKNDTVQKLVQAGKAQAGGQDLAAQSQQKTGLGPEDIERLTVVAKDIKQGNLWVVVATKKKVDRKKVLENLQGAKEAKHEGKTYHVGTPSVGGPGMMPPGGMPGGGMPPGGMGGGMPGGMRGGMPGGGMRGGMPGGEMPGGMGGGMPGGGMPGGMPGGMAPGGGSQTAIYFASDRVVVFGDEKGVQEAISAAKAKKTKGPLEDAIKLAQGTDQVVIGVNLPRAEMESLKKNMTGLAKAYQPLADTERVTAVINFKDRMEVNATLKYADDPKAKASKGAIDSGLSMVKGLLFAAALTGKKEDQESIKKLQDALSAITVEQKGTEVAVKGNFDLSGLDPAALAGKAMGGRGGPGGGGVLPGGEEQIHQNNLKQLALAMHNYAGTHGGRLPPATIYGKDGKPLYSWRVELLPYLEQDNLYREFKKDEPWDSPHNKRLLSRMPKVFALPGAPPGETKTPYKVFTGPNTPFADKTGPHMPAGFPDGTSNTILIVEASTPVEWTRPLDIRPGVGPTLKWSFGSKFGKYYVALADGSVRSLKTTISADTLRKAIDPKDGQPLGADWNN